MQKAFLRKKEAEMKTLQNDPVSINKIKSNF